MTFKLQSYDAVAKGFSKFFNQDELFRCLDNMVNQNQLLKLSESKANRKELNSAMKIIESLY